jgi:hypothetical protein
LVTLASGLLASKTWRYPKIDYEHHTAIVATGCKLMFFVLKEFPFHA